MPLIDERICIEIVLDAGYSSTLTSSAEDNCAGDEIQMENIMNYAGEPTGFYQATYTGPLYINQDDTTNIDVFYDRTDRGFLDRERITVEIKKPATPNQIVASLEIIPLESFVTPMQTVPVLIFAQDDEGYGVECLNDNETDCEHAANPQDMTATAIQNGYIDNIIELNGNSNGAGAYYTEFTTSALSGSSLASFRVLAPGVQPIQAIQQLSINPVTQNLKVLDPVISSDGSSGLLLFIDNQNNPLFGLEDVTNITAEEGLTITAVKELSFSTDNGSGIYVSTLDSGPTSPKKMYNITSSTMYGAITYDSASVELVGYTIDVSCNPEVVYIDKTVVCTAVVRDRFNNPIAVQDHYLRATSVNGSVQNGNSESTNGYTSDTLTNMFGDCVYQFTFQATENYGEAQIIVNLFDKPSLDFYSLRNVIAEGETSLEVLNNPETSAK